MEEPRRAIIFANGIFNHPENAAAEIRKGDIIIAADGGGHLCRQAQIVPDYLVGDFDSLSPADLEYFQQAGSQVLRFPERKDYTDLELALRHASSLGCTQAVVLGALGARWDQSLANLLLPAVQDLADIQVKIVDGLQEITLVRPWQELCISGAAGDIVSLIPLAGDATGIRTQGLEYPLQSETLIFGATRGISNVLLGESACIFIESGLLLCVVIHNNADTRQL